MTAQADVAVFVGQHACEQRVQRVPRADQRAVALQDARGHLLGGEADRIRRHEATVREVRCMALDEALPARQLALAQPVGLRRCFRRCGRLRRAAARDDGVGEEPRMQLLVGQVLVELACEPLGRVGAQLALQRLLGRFLADQIQAQQHHFAGAARMHLAQCGAFDVVHQPGLQRRPATQLRRREAVECRVRRGGVSVHRFFWPPGSAAAVAANRARGR
ncbi:hypothetical protein D3C72_1640740 [compost metagenome]